MTTGVGAYVTEEFVASNGLLEAEIVTDTTELTPVFISPTQMLVNAETYNGTIPGPTLRMQMNDTAIIRLINNLPWPTGIHWHGIELANTADGTPVTQRGVPGGPGAPGSAQAGGTYLYKFTAPRPGIYWYHPHHFHSTNRVFRGLYGMIYVEHPLEQTLISDGVLPGPADTLPLVLSDTTVCQTPGQNADLFDDATLPWAGDGPFPGQTGPRPVDLCETSPLADDPDNPPGVVPGFGANEVPNIQTETPTGPSGMFRVNEGQIVLTNGVVAGARAGSPEAPGALSVDAETLSVHPSQGLRLQIVNCATTRYFRLRLTREDVAAGTDGLDNVVPLVRVGGEGGLINNAVVEGGTVGGFDTKFSPGEILLPPATRADVVIAVPADASGTMTLWTLDHVRTGQGFANVPSAPVMHLAVSDTPVSSVFTIGDGTPILASDTLPSQPDPQLQPLAAATGGLIDPVPRGKTGSANLPITLQIGPQIDGVQGHFGGTSPYTATPGFTSTRWIAAGAIVELTVANATSAHHPFHMHGFSFQPIALEHPIAQNFTWDYVEFRDTVDIPPGYTLRFRFNAEANRPLLDNTTPGGALGRWLFHCHIFFHAHGGMIAELVVAGDDNLGERPYVDVNGSWAYGANGDIARRTGRLAHPDGLNVTIQAHLADGTPFGTLTPNAATPSAGGAEVGWSWQGDEATLPVSVEPDGTTNGGGRVYYVYVTAEDNAGRRDQTVFRVQYGGFDEGADNGDPHLHTLDGQRYDFQSVGEFTLVRDREGMEVQTRQTPVPTKKPVTDSYSGLTSCVSINTAMAARLGSRWLSYQQNAETPERLDLFVDGKTARLTVAGLDLDGHLVTRFDADGTQGLRIDYAHGPVVMVSPRFWNSQQVWYMDVAVSHIGAAEGLIGPMLKGSWLPRLRNGRTLGPRPAALGDRWQDLYRTFADSWRVTEKTSLFTYAPGTSAETFADRDWPALKPPCKVKPGLELPGGIELEGVEIEKAEAICAIVGEDGLRKDCVFDVATTGDEVFAEGYAFAEKLRRTTVSVRVTVNPGKGYGDRTTALVVVVPVSRFGEKPSGGVQLTIDGQPLGAPVRLDETGRAEIPIESGKGRLQAVFSPDGARGADDPTMSPSVSLDLPSVL